jgi:hypothetical protein
MWEKKRMNMKRKGSRMKKIKKRRKNYQIFLLLLLQK